METVLILYPIQPYADVLMGTQELPEVKLEYARIYQRLVKERYPDSRMVYAMFSVPEDPDIADMSQLWNGFSINGKDTVAACGVSFQKHCKSRIYPDPKTIVDFCPQPVGKLVIGGFHLWDCVDKIAVWAYHQGVDVMVDEDLTELFFWSVRDRRGLPVHRIPVLKEESIRQTRRRLSEAGRYFLEDARAERKKRPWMNQL